jgi:SAM-dependent methyltransferase
MTQLSPKQRIQEDNYRIPYHYQDILAQGYKPLRMLEYTCRFEILKYLIGPFSGQRFLDAGCGDGRLLYELRHENIQATGVDYSEKAIAFARAFCWDSGIEFHCRDLTTLDLAGAFDVITFLDTLEHIPPEGIPSVLSALSGLLADDGRLIVSVPTWHTKFQDKHYQHFTRDAFARTMSDFFEPVSMTGYYRKKHKFVVRQLQSIAGNLGMLLGKVGLYRPFSRFVVAYFRKYAALGQPDECLDMIGVFRKKTGDADRIVTD